jgi:hypothetical protein
MRSATPFAVALTGLRRRLEVCRDVLSIEPLSLLDAQH